MPVGSCQVRFGEKFLSLQLEVQIIDMGQGEFFDNDELFELEL